MVNVVTPPVSVGPICHRGTLGTWGADADIPQKFPLG